MNKRFAFRLMSKLLYQLEDTYREKASLNKTPALSKSMNIDIWVVGTSNQLFIRGSQTETKFSKYTLFL